MLDPLSITASVLGLLATSYKICSSLSALIQGFKDAPESARAVLRAVQETRSALQAIKVLFDKISTLPPERKALIHLDHIAVTFSNCILTQSELESLVCSVNWTRRKFRSSFVEKKLLRLLPRLESQKTSLSLMVALLQCQSDLDALHERDKLHSTIEEIIRQNEKLAARLQIIGIAHVDGPSQISLADKRSAVEKESASIFTMTSVDDASSANQADGTFVIESSPQVLPRREFETILHKTWVYRRVKHKERDDVSLTSSGVRTTGWSMLSGISLANISAFSVFRLPIRLEDIDHLGYGLTFERVIWEQKLKEYYATRTDLLDDGKESDETWTLQPGEDFLALNVTKLWPSLHF
ncbi:hypothetical protein B0H63DRAFT_535632 [Podospora didyma]|uniref:Fungal N-terminal domain-containing protein n=1 Tax=Podospora didyma TaxID=330526 RepID=A0AAE0K069_9PEZI|nr:hypothetical protein B0H63DRAFT_535632 [Podospora didyma]